MKYQVKYSCGHEDDVVLYGKMEERYQKLSSYAEGLCSACWKEEQDKVHAAKGEAAKQVADTKGLPQLAGSEKQRAWAETIRDEILYLVDVVAYVSDNFTNALTEGEEHIAAFADELRATTSSKWWIDNARDASKITHKTITHGRYPEIDAINPDPYSNITAKAAWDMKGREIKKDTILALIKAEDISIFPFVSLYKDQVRKRQERKE